MFPIVPATAIDLPLQSLKEALLGISSRVVSHFAAAVRESLCRSRCRRRRHRATMRMKSGSVAEGPSNQR